MSTQTAIIVDIVGLLGVTMLVTGIGMWSIPAGLIALGIIGIAIWLGALGASRRST